MILLRKNSWRLLSNTSKSLNTIRPNQNGQKRPQDPYPRHCSDHSYLKPILRKFKFQIDFLFPIILSLYLYGDDQIWASFSLTCLLAHPVQQVDRAEIEPMTYQRKIARSTDCATALAKRTYTNHNDLALALRNLCWNSEMKISEYLCCFKASNFKQKALQHAYTQLPSARWRQFGLKSQRLDHSKLL